MGDGSGAWVLFSGSILWMKCIIGFFSQGYACKGFLSDVGLFDDLGRRYTEFGKRRSFKGCGRRWNLWS